MFFNCNETLNLFIVLVKFIEPIPYLKMSDFLPYFFRPFSMHHLSPFFSGQEYRSEIWGKSNFLHYFFICNFHY